VASEVFTYADFERMKAALARAAIQAKRVETREQAERMSRNDPCGKRWVVGEEFYEVERFGAD
jgi:hypothetical protein